MEHEEAVAQLEEQWHRCERKLKKAYEEIMAGSGEDPHRIHKLEKQLEKIEQELQDAKQHLLSFDDELGLMHQRQVLPIAVLGSLTRSDLWRGAAAFLESP
eukprot:g7236.t1